MDKQSERAMDSKRFFDDLRKGSIAGCYLLDGEEEYIKDRMLEALREALLPKGLEAMNESVLTDPDHDTLLAAAETLPFGAARRLVLVRELSLLTGTRERDEENRLKRLLDYLAHPNDAICLVFFVRGKADGRKKLTSYLKKYAVHVYCEPLREPELSKWIAREFQRRGKKIALTTCQKLTFAVGSELYPLQGEIEKAAAYTGERETVTDEDIEAACIKSIAYRVFDMAGALLRGDGKAAFAMAEALQRDGEEPPMLLALMQNECRRLLAMRVLRDQGRSPQAIAGELGLAPFIVQRLLPVAMHYREGQLMAMANCCMDNEYAAKSGRLSFDGLVEQTMLSLWRIRGEDA